MKDINNEPYLVAEALGSPLPAPQGSSCYLASYYIDQDSDAIITLGAYATAEEAQIAIINSRCEMLMDWEYDAPWNTDLSEIDEELTGELSFARLQTWLASKTVDEILSEMFDSNEDYAIEKMVVSKKLVLGDISYSVSY